MYQIHRQISSLSKGYAVDEVLSRSVCPVRNDSTDFV